MKTVWTMLEGILWWSSDWDSELSMPWPRINPWSGNRDPASHVAQPKQNKTPQLKKKKKTLDIVEARVQIGKNES